MAETVSASAIILEVLNKDNYENWRIRLQTYLEAQDLWDVIEANDEASKEGESEVEIKAWKKKNATALHTIYISCGSHAFKTIRQIKSAKSAWGTLKAKFGPLVPAKKSSDRSDDNFQDKPLFDAVERNDWKFVEEFLRDHPEAVRSRQPVSGWTILHFAVICGLEQMVKELLQVMSVEEQQIRDNEHLTALLLAVGLGRTSMAKHMAKKNPKILGVPYNYKNHSVLPAGMAFSVGNIDLARYLYSNTLQEDLLAEKGKTLGLSMQAEQYDIASDMIDKCPGLTIFKYMLDDDEYDYITILEDKLIAAFPRINIQPMKLATGNICVDVSTSKDRHITRRNITCSGRLKQFASNASKILGFLPATFKTLLGIEHLNKRNLENTCLSKVLGKISDEIKNLDDLQLEAETSISNAIVHAIAKGAVEFVVLLTRADPKLSVLTDKETGRSMVMVAVQYRQEKIVSLFMRMNITKDFVNFTDYNGNTSLHMTGLLPPSSYLNTIPGPALQMQKELQWFQEIENLLENKILKNARNVEGMTAREYFTEHHEELRKEGEKWMKDTASSYSIVAALIVTMTFAAGFIIPGATNESMRSLSRKKWFLVFLISDAVSLFSSTTSVLMFIGILTSRYYEEAFLKSLPTKLILGMSALFFSIVTMMLCFCAALYEMLQGQQWILIPIILLASVPIYVFVSLQFSLLIQIFKSTYGSGLNIAPKKDKKNWQGSTSPGLELRARANGGVGTG